jgi:hypothetical protein
MVVIFENERFFNEDVYKGMVKSFVGAAKDFGRSSHFCLIMAETDIDIGVTIADPVPHVRWVVGRPEMSQVSPF